MFNAAWKNKDFYFLFPFAAFSRQRRLRHWHGAHSLSIAGLRAHSAPAAPRLEEQSVPSAYGLWVPQVSADGGEGTRAEGKPSSEDLQESHAWSSLPGVEEHGQHEQHEQHGKYGEPACSAKGQGRRGPHSSGHVQSYQKVMHMTWRILHMLCFPPIQKCRSCSSATRATSW